MSPGDESLEREAARLTEAEFAARHPHPFVTFGAPEDAEVQFRTELGHAEPSEHEPVVAPIAKREDSPFQDRISIGRARNSDIVVRHASVSKLHAHFRREATGLTLTDVGSQNGTEVDGRTLVASRPEPVEVGARVTVGSVALRVVDAREAYALLRRRR